MKEFLVEKMRVRIYANRQQLGKAAAAEAARRIIDLLLSQEEISIIFAAAASQHEFLQALAEEPGIEWQRVSAFHMDEYRGLPPSHPQRFGNFLQEKIFGRLPFKQVFYLNESGHDDPQECDRYAALLEQYKPAITCMGIGENGHLAFNDPHVANFHDPALVKIVDLDEACKHQQVNDGCFPSIAEVPSYAYTLTIPALMQADHIFCMVPGKNKAPAVRNTLNEAISEQHPATILREHQGAILFLDEDSAGLLG
ncbi:MAG: glucosamine-6-phosphate deaminase [Williamsia sp.]|nr:glucosamine-6-phosphate deaminase [Williamsia sp.]